MVLYANELDTDGLMYVKLMPKDLNNDKEKFKFELQSNGTYRTIWKFDTVRGLDVPYSSYSANAWIINQPYGGGTNQQWIFEEISDEITSSMTHTSDGRNVKTVTDSRGNVTTNLYDAKNRLLTGVTDAKGNTTQYTYDPNNDRLTSVSRKVGELEIKNTYTYDKDKLKSITHNGFNYNFTYDVFGNTTATAIGDQVLSTNTYLPHNGPLASSTYANGLTISNVYDKQYRVTEQKYNNVPAFRYKYDSFGNSIEHQDLLNSVNYYYNYDFINRLIGLTTSHGQSLRLSYDDKNRLDTVINKVKGSSTKTQYVYGDQSKKQKTGLVYGVKIDGKDTVNYTYDELSRVSKRTLNLTSPFTTTFGYLKGAGERTTTTLVESVQNGDSKLTYTYDELGNITAISENGVLKNRYAYDELSQLVREEIVEIDRAFTYAYNAGGNRTEKHTYSLSTGEEIPVDGATQLYCSYTYAGDQLFFSNQFGRFGYFNYDEIGNITQYAEINNFTWNGRRLMGGRIYLKPFEYQYDDNGIRTQKKVRDATTQYFLNGSSILAQITTAADGTTERLDFFYDDAGDLMGFKLDGQNYYYIRNLQNDIIGILDSAGVQVVSYSYDAWGNPLGVKGTLADTVGQKNPFRYRGYYYDKETGMYYLNSRYYMPKIGRFISTDGIFYTTSLTEINLYSYCGNNPIMHSDYTGKKKSFLASVGSFFVGIGTALKNAWDSIGKITAIVSFWTMPKKIVQDKKIHVENVVNIGYSIGKGNATSSIKTKTFNNKKLVNDNSKYIDHCQISYTRMTEYVLAYSGVDVSNKAWNELTAQQQDIIIQTSPTWDPEFIAQLQISYGSDGTEIAWDLIS